MTARSLIGLLLLAVLGLVLQATWLTDWRLGVEWPDLLLVLAIGAGLRYGFSAGLSSGVLAGLITGLACGFAQPAFLASRALVGAGASLLRDRWHGDNPLAQIAVVSLGVVTAEGLFAVGYPAVLANPDWLGRVLTRALLSAILAPAAMILLEWAAGPELEPA